jgi:hypothetical protein
MTDVRAMALAFLDEVSAPLTPRQIERALREHGIGKGQRVVLASALHRLNIVAVRPKENDHQSMLLSKRALTKPWR